MSVVYQVPLSSKSLVELKNKPGSGPIDWNVLVKDKFSQTLLEKFMMFLRFGNISKLLK